MEFKKKNKSIEVKIKVVYVEEKDEFWINCLLENEKDKLYSTTLKLF